MFRNIVFSAFGAGLAVCVVVSALQFFTTEPLILHAEEFEDAGGGHHHADAGAPAHDHGDAAEEEEEEEEEDEGWGPADGFERSAFTVVANLLVGIAVALILLALMVLKGGGIDAWRGLMWGAAGFAAAALLPSLGLPPELPGTPAGDLAARQAWWLAAVVASAGGIALIAFGRTLAFTAAGIALIVLPHAFGAPLPPSHDVTYPGALAGEFVAASLVVSAALWIVAGAAAGWLHQRLAEARTG